MISGGENIWPAQVEAVLGRHRSVLDVAVGGRPDAQWGSRVVAYVVLSPVVQGTEPAAILGDLRELVKERLSPFAAPRELVVVAELPRTEIGKVRRAELASLVGLSARIA